MKIFSYLIIAVVLGLASGSNVYAENIEEPQIIRVDASYPVQDNTINLQNDSTELNIHVESKNAKVIRFYYLDSESDAKQLLEEDDDLTDGSDYEMKFDSMDGFACGILIEAVSDKGASFEKELKVYKDIDMKPTDKN